MPFPPMPTQVKCPNCGQSYIAQIHTVVDVGESPELKENFIRGELNRARCPHCGSGGFLSTPLVYHDPEKELLISFVPAEASLPADQQEQLVGSLVNAVMNSVPAEKRKGYFFRPRTALTLESLYDAILEAEGISKEVLEQQRARLKLVSDLRTRLDDEEGFDKLVEANRDNLDYSFFLMLSDLVDDRRADDDEESATRLEALRERLLERVSPAMPKAAPQGASYDELIALLQDSEAGDVWRHTVALNRPRLDYGFFQALTARIEAAEGSGDTDTAKSLGELRQRVLAELDAQNEAARQAEDEASLLIMQISEAEDLRAAVEEHLSEIDDIFFVMLSRYLRTAQGRGNTERAGKLSAILDTARELLEDALPPDLRLVNRLIRAEHPDGTAAVLEAHRGLLDDEFLKSYDEHVAALGRAGGDDLVEHLKKVREQIVAKMTILRG